MLLLLCTEVLVRQQCVICDFCVQFYFLQSKGLRIQQLGK